MIRANRLRLEEYNRARSHQGGWCYGKTPMQTLIDTLPVAREKTHPGRDDVGHRNLSDTHHDRRPSDQIHISTGRRPAIRSAGTAGEC